MPQNDPNKIARKLLKYCVDNDWAGYDPYDALNSRLFEALPFLNSRVPRVAMTQLLKRSPWNVRALLQIPKTQNSKGLGIMIRALIKLECTDLLEQPDLITALADKLAAMRSPGEAHWCWGYSFPWQTRTIVVPRGSPNAVCTIFVASSLLDLFEHTRESKYLEMAVSAAEFVSKLIWSDAGGITSLSYPLATQRSLIHNANFLGAGLFCRIKRLAGETRFVEPALKLARYSASRQRADGSWAYGELPTQQWVDNFHTGYNLDGLRTIGETLETDEFEGCVKLGFDFYRRHFFTSEAVPRYFHDRTYPVDSHCVSQSILTLLQFQDLEPSSVELAGRVFDWAVKNLWDERGYFYYRKLPLMRIKTSYMRWVQAWMLLAVATLAEDQHKKSIGNKVSGGKSAAHRGLISALRN